MSMKVSLNTQYPTNSMTGVSREKATAFVNSDDKEVNRLATKVFKANYGVENKKFDKHVNTTLKALPLVAIASGLATKKGIRGSLLQGASWGLVFAAPDIVNNVANRIEYQRRIKGENPNTAATSTMGRVAGSIGLFLGLNSLANKAFNSEKLLANPKITDTLNKATEKVTSKLGGITEKAGQKLNEIGSKIKVPEALNSSISKLKDAVPKSLTNNIKDTIKSPVVTKLANTAKSASKYVLNHAPSILAFATIGAVVAKDIANASRLNNIKSDIKQAQLDTAKTLVKDYSTENSMLKAENSELNEALDTPKEADPSEE